MPVARDELKASDALQGTVLRQRNNTYSCCYGSRQTLISPMNNISCLLKAVHARFLSDTTPWPMMTPKSLSGVWKCLIVARLQEIFGPQNSIVPLNDMPNRPSYFFIIFFNRKISKKIQRHSRPRTLLEVKEKIIKFQTTIVV